MSKHRRTTAWVSDQTQSDDPSPLTIDLPTFTDPSGPSSPLTPQIPHQPSLIDVTHSIHNVHLRLFTVNDHLEIHVQANTANTLLDVPDIFGLGVELLMYMESLKLSPHTIKLSGCVLNRIVFRDFCNLLGRLGVRHLIFSDVLDVGKNGEVEEVGLNLAAYRLALESLTIVGPFGRTVNPSISLSQLAPLCLLGTLESLTLRHRSPDSKDTVTIDISKDLANMLNFAPIKHLELVGVYSAIPMIWRESDPPLDITIGISVGSISSIKQTRKQVGLLEKLFTRNESYSHINSIALLVEIPGDDSVGWNSSDIDKAAEQLYEALDKLNVAMKTWFDGRSKSELKGPFTFTYRPGFNRAIRELVETIDNLNDPTCVVRTTFPSIW